MHEAKLALISTTHESKTTQCTYVNQPHSLRVYNARLWLPDICSCELPICKKSQTPVHRLTLQK
jgi:hypothetical protein